MQRMVWYRVLGFRVESLGCRVQGLELKVRGAG